MGNRAPITVAEARRRLAAKKRSRHPASRRADQRVAAYLKRIEAGETQTSIAASEGLHPSTIVSAIKAYARRNPDVVIPKAPSPPRARKFPNAVPGDRLTFLTDADRERFLWIEARLAVLMAEVKPLREERRALDALARGRDWGRKPKSGGKRISPAQRELLHAVQDLGDPWLVPLRGVCAHSRREKSIRVLLERGFIEHCEGSHLFRLTDKGRSAIKR